MTEPDGANEVMAGSVRVALTAAALAAEVAARRREERVRQVQAANEREARELAARLAAEVAAARASVAGVDRDGWWATAEVSDIAAAWGTAATWRGADPQIDRVAERIRTEVRERYAVDVDDLQADPGALHEALQAALEERPTTAGESQRDARTGAQDTEAAVLMTAADAADRAQQTARDYDSPARRAEFATAVAGVADAETTEAVVLSDLYQGRPAVEAVTAARGAAARVKRSRSGTGLGQSQRQVRGR